MNEPTRVTFFNLKELVTSLHYVKETYGKEEKKLEKVTYYFSILKL